ncbi:YheO-like PAS domain protein [Clostridium sp. C105KSO13]|nr:YheO-like PAS domain protein [Clostridium sp. C105KSO13]
MKEANILGRRLDLLKQLAHGLAVQFGSSCEIVIHDLTRKELEHSVVYIENGYISNRKLGDGPSSVVLETLNRKPSKIQDRLSYLTKTEDGRILKSSTMYIREDDDHIAYIFSLNYDITALLAAQTAMGALTDTESDKDSESGNRQPQKITHNVNELLDMLIEQALALVGKPVALMNKNDKVAVVHYLNDAGAFLITKSGDKVASLLGISKFTLYSYMDAGR